VSVGPRTGEPAAPTRWARAVLHVDMDAFYVNVELLRRPELVGRPVAVGGTGRRGVVASASYEARAFGVRSAMPTAQARRLCPATVFLAGDHARYGEVSGEVMALFRQYTPLVEPLSLDEAFLDVTGGQRLFGPPPVLAATIRAEVASRLGLPCCVGVAPTKFLAKLASQAAKPRATPRGPEPGIGVMVVEPGCELAFLHPLPLAALWGVGPATLAKLSRLGIASVGELAALPERTVVSAVGDAVGRHLHALACGRDDRPVEPDRAVKSIGHEETFPYDLVDRAACERELVRLADAVAARLRRQRLAARTLTLKVRFGGFRTVTRSRTVTGSTDSAPAILVEARSLLDTLSIEDGVRLLGISASGLEVAGGSPAQLSFDDLDPAGGGVPDWTEAERAIDAIRARFGVAAIGPAALAEGGGLRPLRPDRGLWGPDERPSDGPLAPP